MSKPRKPCAGCRKRTKSVHPILDVHCCPTCVKNDDRFGFVCAECALDDFGLSETDLMCIRSTTYTAAHAGRLKGAFPVYLLRHVEEMASS
jgi:hypothetical protein